MKIILSFIAQIIRHICEWLMGYIYEKHSSEWTNLSQRSENGINRFIWNGYDLFHTGSSLWLIPKKNPYEVEKKRVWKPLITLVTLWSKIKSTLLVTCSQKFHMPLRKTFLQTIITVITSDSDFTYHNGHSQTQTSLM